MNSIYHLGRPRESGDSNIYRSGYSADLDIGTRRQRVCCIASISLISLFFKKEPSLPDDEECGDKRNKFDEVHFRRAEEIVVSAL